MPLADGVTGGDPSDPAWQPLGLSAVVQARATAPEWFSVAEIRASLQPVRQALQTLQTLSEAGATMRVVGAVAHR